MFDPGSGSLTFFLSRIRGLKKHNKDFKENLTKKHRVPLGSGIRKKFIPDPVPGSRR
jgi:hypothetical protein